MAPQKKCSERGLFLVEAPSTQPLEWSLAAGEGIILAIELLQVVLLFSFAKLQGLSDR